MSRRDRVSSANQGSAFPGEEAIQKTDERHLIDAGSDVAVHEAQVIVCTPGGLSV